MNLNTLRMALAGAGTTLGYLRNSRGKKKREVYDTLLEAVREGRIEDLADETNLDDLEGLFSTARLEAGDVTRDIHDRLDRRRAAFAAAAPDRKARRDALSFLEDDRKKGKKSKGSNAGKVIGTLLGLAGAAAAGWAAWEYWLKDKLAAGGNEPSAKTTTKTYAPAPTRTETDGRGTSTLVYSTRTADAQAGTADAQAGTAGTTGTAGTAGPLGEEPAERDEELLASIDEQLTTLDTLDDDQREGTTPRHGEQAEAAGKHELNADREVRGGEGERR